MTPSPSPSPQPIIHMTTVSAPTNIACIKYWGKHNVKLNTPLNDSVSITLHQDDLKAITTVAASKSFTRHCLWLNGVEVDVSNRVTACINGVQQLACDGAKGYTKDEWKNMHFHVSSYNTFPTAAGLASSAAGYAALVYGLAQLMEASEQFPNQLSCIARQGSGSACRSMYGGFVAWRKGESGDCDDDGETANDANVMNTKLHNSSKAEQICDESHWPEMRAILLVVSDVKKTTSSTSGMNTSVATSELLLHRAQEIVPRRMTEIIQAWRSKDFSTFATLTMKDSNQFHAVCLDTFPPICYMNDTSRNIITIATAYNDYYQSAAATDNNTSGLRVAYTFDAGPNAVLYCLEQHVDKIQALMKHYFCAKNGEGENAEAAASSPPLSSALLQACDVALYGNEVPHGVAANLGAVQRMYLTRVGPGPRVVHDVCNLDPVTGLNVYQPTKDEDVAS
ncbi:hypothetical protein MPSEU_000397800 [Mayamaea pseudoterrestris]|nr:hypothetical protein MPSEU_000397800 [Mayamaea pseudoterrestris]